MEKIKLGDFIGHMATVITYSKKHMIKEDWSSWSESESVDFTFDEMEHYVTALSKCCDYMLILKEYDKHGNKRESIFLDD